MSNNGCKLCAFGVGVEDNLSQREVAVKYGVARSSVYRHLKHVAGSEGTPKPRDTPKNTKSHDVLSIQGNTGTAEVSLGEDLDTFFTKRGIDPATVEITSRKIGEWQVSTSTGTKTLESQKISFTIKEVPDDVDLPALFASIERASATRKEKTDEGLPKNRSLFVIWADPQTGKCDVYGGTPELITRVMEKRIKLDAYIDRHKASSAFFLNAGDAVENIENTGSQIATNDLSLVDQIDVEATLEQSIIEVLAARHDEVTVAVVPSNHCQMRKGKSLIGKPGDDWGIFIARQLERAFGMNKELYGHIKFVYPENPWIEHLVVDAGGTKVGLVHGHQKMKPDAIPAWWAGQLHGGMLSEAEILVTGHFHHFIARATGRHIATGRQKYHLQAPALDNGSAWYQNVSGESSEPGLMVFMVDENGLDLESLTIL